MKKKIPLQLLSNFEPLIQENYDIIQNLLKDNAYYYLIDREENSDFFFLVYIDGSKRISNVDRSKYSFEWQPSSETRTSNSVTQGSVDDIIAAFKSWIGFVKKYNETISVHDDNFEKHYSDYFFSQYKILDNDANILPFNPSQQELFEKYLDYIEPIVTNVEELKNETVASDIKEGIAQLKTELPSSTKNQAIQKLTKIWAKLYKHSKKLSKIAMDKAMEIFIKQLVEQGVKYLPLIIEGLNQHAK